MAWGGMIMEIYHLYPLSKELINILVITHILLNSILTLIQQITTKCKLYY